MDKSTSEKELVILKKHINGMFESFSLGLQGHRVANGSDYYKCPACFAKMETLGYSDMTTSFDDVEHDPNCDLLILKRLVSE